MKKDGIKLNLVMTYPVWWSMDHVMSDYIQNFYDALGAERFSKDFVYLYDEDRKTLRMEGKKGFQAEWLQYIGASTKREDAVCHTAGKFGEGFKIASLCAYRDHKMSIHMESQDWTLDVVTISGKIDGRDVEFLGYDIKERIFQDGAVLLLGNVSPRAYQEFLSEIQSFYYPENPVFGECIVYAKDYAVYRTNYNTISKKNRVEGKVFACMQERAKISRIPLIFCNHKYVPDKEDDRDRRSFGSYYIKEAVAGIVSELEGEELREVFMAFRLCWQGRGNHNTGVLDWSRLIQRMIWKLCDEAKVRQKVYEELKGQYIADMPPYIIRQDRNKYRTAVDWFRTSDFYGTCKLLPYYFSDLGISSIYSLCEKYDGFHVIHEPDELQKGRIRVLERMAWDIFSNLFCYDKLPECRILVNKGTPNEGLARTVSAGALARNGAGLKVVSVIREINLRKELFYRDAFPEAMVVYMHEILHQFGGDASRQFRTVILAMNCRIMENYRKLEEYEREWIQAEECGL